MSDDIFDRLDALVTKQRERIVALEAERDAIRRQADAATINLGNARDAHQEELGKAAAIELRLTERVAELEALVETMKAEVWEANEDNFQCGRIAAEQGCLVANAPSDAVRTLANRYVEALELIEQLRCGDLDAFHDGELEPDRAAAFREHLGRCAKCAAGLDSLMQETVATEPGRRRWAPQACVDAIACAECGAARGARCSTDRPLHTSRWDAWKAAGFPEAATEPGRKR